jgi:peroxiredoxin
MYDEMQNRCTTVIAVAQEDADLESHAKFLRHFEPSPPFEIAADLGRKQTTTYDRTTTYLIDRSGRVRQVFPNLIRHRASWRAILHEIDRLPPPADS